MLEKTSKILFSILTSRVLESLGIFMLGCGVCVCVCARMWIAEVAHQCSLGAV